MRTLTFDNGSEFAEHELLDIVLKSRSYFADPFASWQRGSNENTNGLLREYLPKRCDLSAVTDAQLQQIEERLNNRPRKRLGFRTPNEVFSLPSNMLHFVVESTPQPTRAIADSKGVLTMFDTFDRTGQAEFSFTKKVVFRALVSAVQKLKERLINPSFHALRVATSITQ